MKITLKPLRVPEFVLVEPHPVIKMGDDPSIHVSDLDYEDAKSLCDQFVRDFMAKAGYPVRTER